jgi:flagellar biosynthetic protein FliP
LKAFKQKSFWIKLSILVIAIAALASPSVMAQSLTLDMGTPDGATTGDGSGNASLAGRVLQLIALLTVLSLAPSILIMMTSFTRIIIVLSFLRTAMGVQQTPPNTVMISLALFLTFFIMAPTFNAAYETAVKPLLAEEITEMEAFDLGIEPFKAFMLQHTRPKDLELFTEISEIEPVDTAMDVPIHIVIPSFMISELRRAFEIGFILFLPFLIIDMVTASILMSMGMMMLPPVMISLPFKIVFFVLVDGWYLVAGSLIKSFDSSLPLPEG